jgi:predicted MFS family arabinose efflux permease
LARHPRNALRSANQLLARLGRAQLTELPEPSTSSKAATLKDVVRGPLAARTLLLWSGFFLVMSSFYFVVSWTPRLLVEAGLPVGSGLSGGVLLNVGGVAGTLLLGVLSSRFGIFRLQVAALVAAAAAIAGFGLVSDMLSVALPFAPVVGFFLFTSMVGLYVITPSIYPTALRNTGTGLAIGIGRLGAVASPYLAGVLLAGGWETSRVYVAFALPALLAAVAVSWLARRHRG